MTVVMFHILGTFKEDLLFFIYLPKTLKNKQNINKHSFSLRKVTTQTQILLVSLQQDNISKNGCNDFYYLLKEVFI